MGCKSALVGRLEVIIYSLELRQQLHRSLQQNRHGMAGTPCLRSANTTYRPNSIDLHMERKNLLPPALLDQLRRHLYELYFIHRRLPVVLQRAVVATRTQRWGAFFREQVSSVQVQRAELDRLIAGWGERLRPCACSEVDDLLNEIHHALAARHEEARMEDRVHEVFLLLCKVVLARLEEGVDLARRLGDNELAEHLTSLFTGESDRQRSMPEMRAA